MKIGPSIALIGLLTVPGLAHLAAPSSQEAAKVGAKVPAFTAQAVSTIDSNDAKLPTAYLVVGVKCGATPRYEKRLKALEEEFRAKGVGFVYVFPNSTESAEEKAAFVKKVGLRGPVVDDKGAKIASALECKNTCQAILVDKEGKIVYRGGIDDNPDEAKVERRHLAEALKEVLAGKPVTTTTSKVFG
jgi:peroxiredoxin